ncbi:murein hydrolase activator EnvC family protein [Tropicimonas isoalkanivorans]|uniref:Septal ring factor EnvC, activator of murein hydrolases AmiA and AmiB n=1 Tax=Tropicimonas isoalkanivorans TaxID=441112 RepID=A0A1I1MT68_9RHOB|nr:peptidoglycan DD-metalloendopeptidase family protein [Tropicimonas isoalkanivorans]SFC84780.1 Septal ring factor EnvC, activator of murein hydrolases AmiA and AmiB [Tropicimonas isoalkanivorans]
MIRAGWLAASLFCLAGAATAATDPAVLAREAADQLQAAAESLDAAKGARSRVRALTRTVQAYEDGLAALRAGMRLAARQERILDERLAARDAEVSRLLGALISIERSPAPLLLLHPSGPVGMARSGMMLRDLTPEVQAEVERLSAELDEIAALAAVQEEAGAALRQGLQGAQEARTALSQAMAARTDLPKRFTADPERMRRLLETAETLDAFAAGLGTLALSPAENADFAALRGVLPWPVQGVRLRGYREPDAAGIVRPGVILATRPGALVTAPAEATIRYVGPLLDYGNVMILEPANDTLLVLAGMETVYGEAGEVVTAGLPLGLMGGTLPANGADGGSAQDGGGAARDETLYMELRLGETPVDPAEWFTAKEDG